MLTNIKACQVFDYNFNCSILFNIIFKFNICINVILNLKLQSVTFGALVVNKQNCVRLAEEHCSRNYFSLFMSMMNHTGTGLLRSGTYPNSLK